MSRALALFVVPLSLVAAACSPQETGRTGDPGGGGDGSANTSDDGGGNQGGNDDGGTPQNGNCQNQLDLTGCGCDTPGATRSCYTGPAATENVGACKAGTQTCSMNGEFSTWGPCQGEVTPTMEVCSDQADHDCSGKVGCDDPMCAGMMGCCSPGQMRSCYGGPQGTDGVGQCHGGMQTCDQNGAWGPCNGQVLPGSELGQCSDGKDNDCNGKTDCQDLVCIFDSHCAPKSCNPGDMQACYSGPQGTSGVGVCHGGTQTCDQSGQWGACTGEVDPGSEGGNCTDGLDNDCNGLVDCKDPACATAPSCCTTSGGSVDTTIWANSPSSLYTVDPSSFNVTKVGDFNAGDQMTDIALTPSGELYAISFTTLYHVDKTTAQATAIADVGGSGNNSLTFLPNGNLLAADAGGYVKVIDPSNGQVTVIGNMNDGLVASGDMVAVHSGIMYGVSSTSPGGGDASSSNYLLRVSTSNGVATAVGPIGYGGVWGLAYAGTKVIGFTNAGEILLVDPQTGKGTLLANKGIEFWGATQSPLVQDNVCM